MATESTLKNMLLTLLVVTLVSSAAVGFIYSLTKEPIAAVRVQKINASLAEVIPTFDSIHTFKVATDGDTLVFYETYYNGAPVGTAIETFDDNGYCGRIGIMVGFLPNGTINGVTVLAQKETPGLGAKMSDKQKEGAGKPLLSFGKSSTDAKPVFTTQFLGKNPIDFKLAVKQDGGKVDAITASTISSRAFCGAVQRAYDALTAHRAANMSYYVE
jgi:electron transport complex protein RnfG